ncbi:T9SS type A sorting domain-containing protein [Halocola ammonii]
MKLLITTLSLIISIYSIAQDPWIEIPTNTTKQLNTISFGSSSVGYIGGNDSLLLKTTDGGQTWSEINFSGVDLSISSSSITNLQFIDEQVGFMITGPNNGFYKTEDGGLTWSQQTFAGNMCFSQGLFFWNENNGIVGGSGCFQGEHIEVYNGGEFTVANISTPSWLAEDLVIDIDFFDQNFGLAVSPSRFLRTSDGGQNWDTIPSITTNQLTSIEVVNDTLAYAGYIDDQSSGFGLLVTHDGGLTWGTVSQMATFAYPDYNDVHETSNGYLIAVGKTDFGNQGMIFDNSGEGWWFEYTDQSLNAIDSYGDSTVFAVGDSGLVVTNADFGINVNEIQFEELQLTVYPNPASITLTIEFESTEKGKYELIDLTGRTISSGRVKNESETIELSELPNGTYILRVKAGERLSTQKVIVQK